MLMSSILQVKVTEVLGGGKFYVQIVGDSRIGAIQNLGVKDKAPLPPGSFIPEKGALVLAQYSADNSWNRAMVCDHFFPCQMRLT